MLFHQSDELFVLCSVHFKIRNLKFVYLWNNIKPSSKHFHLLCLNLWLSSIWEIRWQHITTKAFRSISFCFCSISSCLSNLHNKCLRIGSLAVAVSVAAAIYMYLKTNVTATRLIFWFRLRVSLSFRFIYAALVFIFTPPPTPSVSLTHSFSSSRSVVVTRHRNSDGVSHFNASKTNQKCHNNCNGLLTRKVIIMQKISFIFSLLKHCMRECDDYIATTIKFSLLFHYKWMFNPKKKEKRRINWTYSCRNSTVIIECNLWAIKMQMNVL